MERSGKWTEYVFSSMIIGLVRLSFEEKLHATYKPESDKNLKFRTLWKMKHSTFLSLFISDIFLTKSCHAYLKNEKEALCQVSLLR